MKKLLFILVIFLFACSNKQKADNRLLGNFIYVAYHLSDDKDSIAISLDHYLEIDSDGDYKLIQRNANSSTGYYYGITGTDLFNALLLFTKDSAVELHADKSEAFAGKILTYDYVTTSGKRKIKFFPGQSLSGINKLQLQLDSLIGSSGKKERAAFNIDNYLKEIMTENVKAKRLDSLAK